MDGQLSYVYKRIIFKLATDNRLEHRSALKDIYTGQVFVIVNKNKWRRKLSRGLKQSRQKKKRSERERERSAIGHFPLSGCDRARREGITGPGVSFIHKTALSRWNIWENWFPQSKTIWRSIALHFFSKNAHLVYIYTILLYTPSPAALSTTQLTLKRA